MKKIPIVCLIDDDEIYQFAFTKEIERIQLVDKIVNCYDGEQALNYILSHQKERNSLPDIIFLDINMPVIDGWEFIEKYTKITPQLIKKSIIYMISSSINDMDIQRAKKISEISDYIIKPVSRSQILSIFNSVLVA